MFIGQATGANSEPSEDNLAGTAAYGTYILLPNESIFDDIALALSSDPSAGPPYCGNERSSNWSQIYQNPMELSWSHPTLIARLRLNQDMSNKTRSDPAFLDKLFTENFLS